MAETATQFMTSITANLNENPEENLQTLLYKLTIVYKCYGKRLNQNDKNIVCEAFETFANRGIMKGTILFGDYSLGKKRRTSRFFLYYRRIICSTEVLVVEIRDSSVQ